MLLKGQWVSGQGTFEVRDPQNGAVLATVPAGTARDVEAAVAGAGRGREIARAVPAHERKAILHRAAEILRAQGEEIARLLARDSSKTIREARREVVRAVNTMQLSAEEATRLHGETIPFDQRPGAEGRIGFYERFPVGIVGAITPFNDPLNLVVHKVAPAVAAGNAVVLKPASLAPLCAYVVVDALIEAGLPPEVVSLVTGDGRVLGEALASHPDVPLISFTGGLATGERITRIAGVKKLVMELGANSPAIVLRDADLERAVAATVSGGYGNAGQNCLGVQRILLDAPVYKEFCARFLEQVAALRMGDKADELTDMGPMISESAAQRVESWVHEAISLGARLLAGGRRTGAFYEPTVLEGVPRGCTLDREEVYGPVVSLYRVEGLDEAIALANDTPYGLQAGIFTHDIDLALRCARELDMGGVMINDSSDFRVDAMPFGGVKGSGLGREGVRYAAEEMTEIRVVCVRLA